MAKECELVIIIPDSPGSFAELGLFSVEEKIRSKVLVLFNKKYKKHKDSYIHRGPKMFVEKYSPWGVHFVDYSKYDSIWKIVENTTAGLKENILAPKVGVK